MDAACHTCHGLKGEGDGALVPRIAAMDAGYLVRQLGFFADGQRSHPQMTWLARQLDTSERMAVSDYYAKLSHPAIKSRAGANPKATCAMANADAIYHEGIAERGLPSCASCHGDDGAGVGGGNPSLIGQSAAYLVEQLRQWRIGRRYGDPQAVMHDVASKLREDEIIPIAGYIADGLVPPGRPEFQEECR